jgi:hypothetical protein
MSVPYGGSQPAVPQPHSPGDARGRQNLGFILALVAAGLGLVVYACSFSDDAFDAGVLGLVLPLLLGGGLLAGANALPKRPNTLLPATLLVALGFLILLLLVVKNEGDTSAIVVVILIAALLELAAVAAALLMDHGLVRMAPRTRSYGAPAGGWSPQSGGFPQQQGYGAPGYGQQPGQYGQQYGGAPAGGGQVGGQAGGQPQYGQGGPAGGGQHGGQHSRQHAAQPGQPGGSQSDRPSPQFGQQPYGQQPYGGGGQPGTPPGGFSGTS